jgi:hypothetical protein
MLLGYRRSFQIGWISGNVFRLIITYHNMVKFLINSKYIDVTGGVEAGSKIVPVPPKTTIFIDINYLQYLYLN